MLTLQDVHAAADALRGRVTRTPLLRCEPLSVWLKPENLQQAGAFKLRGALNKILSIPETDRARGVVAFSSGNHAQGVALAARMLGIPATIVMPADALAHKVRATEGYGARVVTEGVTVSTRADVAARIAEEQRATLVPPFDDRLIVAGQGTVGLEIAEDLPEVDAVVVPLGGGGLLSGVALAVKSLCPRARVYGVEPEAGNDGQRSFREGRIVEIDPPATIADGARTIHIGTLPFEIIRRHVDDIFTVSDAALLDAMAALAMHAKLVVEPTGALAAAAVTSGLIPTGGQVCAVLSGGNAAPETLAAALTGARW